MFYKSLLLNTEQKIMREFCFEFHKQNPAETKNSLFFYIFSALRVKMCHIYISLHMGTTTWLSTFGLRITGEGSNWVLLSKETLL